MAFSSPQWLWLLAAVAALTAVYLVLQLRRAAYVVRFSNLALLASVAPRRPGWRRHLTFGLLLAALAVLTLGLAEPTAAVRVARDRATVILAIDVSPSMIATDVLPSRLQASQAGANLFTGLLPAAINLGLVKFGGQASVVVTPTLDRTAVTSAIDALTLINSTAIGEAVFTSLDAIATFSRTFPASAPPPARIVLMSDGANNAGRPVTTAIHAALAAHVPVSTIAFGADTGTVTIGGETVPVPADKTTLRALALQTGGTFHTAATAAELRSVYTDIGRQIGYTTARRIIAWRFLAGGAVLAFAATAAALLWTGRLL